MNKGMNMNYVLLTVISLSIIIIILIMFYLFKHLYFKKISRNYTESRYNHFFNNYVSNDGVDYSMLVKAVCSSKEYDGEGILYEFSFLSESEKRKFYNTAIVIIGNDLSK